MGFRIVVWRKAGVARARTQSSIRDDALTHENTAQEVIKVTNFRQEERKQDGESVDGQLQHALHKVINMKPFFATSMVDLVAGCKKCFADLVRQRTTVNEYQVYVAVENLPCDKCITRGEKYA